MVLKARVLLFGREDDKVDPNELLDLFHWDHIGAPRMLESLLYG